jgi:hypothetical protein
MTDSGGKIYYLKKEIASVAVIRGRAVNVWQAELETDDAPIQESSVRSGSAIVIKGEKK